MLHRHVLFGIIVTWLSIGLFFKGFLLTKRQVNERGLLSLDKKYIEAERDYIEDHQGSKKEDKDTESKTFSRKQKIILFIVDALRLDFMTYHPEENSSGTCNPSYNRFNYMHMLLRENKSQCSLLGFMADPPTTTSQRLKGIMTGSLPAFVEMGENFNSAAVTEDSLIEQWSNKGLRIAMLGDDTWIKLFPRAFNKSFPFDSFNTRDLNTVDDGILRHLFPLLEQGHSTENSDVAEAVDFEWDILIIHFLGVDHVGHTYNSQHPLMNERLSLMNDVLHKIIVQSMLSKNTGKGDTLLLMFGDHGMTDAGEHGGNSRDEMLSGLFAYTTNYNNMISNCKPQIFSHLDSWSIDENSTEAENMLISPRVVEQVDFAPTLAILSDVAIPFSSIGQVIPDILLRGTDLSPNILLLSSYRVNSVQVMQFLMHYFLGNECKNALDETEQKIRDILNLTMLNCSPLFTQQCLEDFIFDYIREFVVRKGSMCSQCKCANGPIEGLFDMFVNATVVTDLTLNLTTSHSISDQHWLHSTSVVLHQDFLSASLSHCRMQWTQFGILSMLGGACLCLSCLYLFIYAFYRSIQSGSIFKEEYLLSKRVFRRSADHLKMLTCANYSSKLTFALVLFHWMSTFSNSFIIEEEKLVFFSIQAISMARLFEEVKKLSRRIRKYQHSLSKKHSLRKGRFFVRAVCFDKKTVFLVCSCVMELSALCSIRWILDCKSNLSSSPHLMSPSPASNSDMINRLVADWATMLLLNFVYILAFGSLNTLLRHPKRYTKASQQQESSSNACSVALFAVAAVCLVPTKVIHQLDVLDVHALNSSSPAEGWLHKKNFLEAFILLNDQKSALRNLLSWIVLACGVSGVSLEVVRFSRGVQADLLLIAFNAYFHLANLVILVSTATSVMAIEGQLLHFFFLVSSLLFSYFGEFSGEESTCTDLKCSSDRKINSIKRNSLYRSIQIAIQTQLMGRLVFFLTGHHYDFGTLQLSAGLIGVDSFHFYYAAFMVALNTLGFDFLAGILIFVLSLVFTDTNLYGSNMSISLIALIFQIGKLSASMFCALWMRRHLMLWAVFAPKVIFEALFAVAEVLFHTAIAFHSVNSNRKLCNL